MVLTKTGHIYMSVPPGLQYRGIQRRISTLSTAVLNCVELPDLALEIAEKPTFHGIGEIFHVMSAEFPLLSAEFPFLECIPFSERRILAGLLGAVFIKA